MSPVETAHPSMSSQNASCEKDLSFVGLVQQVRQVKSDCLSHVGGLVLQQGPDDCTWV